MKLLLVSTCALLLQVSSAWAATYTYAEDIDPPWFYKDAHGAYRGLFVEAIRGIFAQPPLKGMHIRFKVLPVKRLSADLQRGTLDMAPLVRTPEREKYGVFTVPPLVAAVCVYMKEGNPKLSAVVNSERFLTMETLKKKPLKVAAVSGNGWFQTHIARHKGQLKITYTKGEGAEILWVLSGRADILVDGEETIKYKLKELRKSSRLLQDKKSRLVPLPVTFEGGRTPWPLMISKHSPLAKKLDKVNEAITLWLQSQKGAGKGQPCTKPL